MGDEEDEEEEEVTERATAAKSLAFRKPGQPTAAVPQAGLHSTAKARTKVPKQDQRWSNQRQDLKRRRVASRGE